MEEPDAPEPIDYETPVAGATDDDVVAFCTGCLNTVPDSMAHRDTFLKAGRAAGVCKWCGGALVVTWIQKVESLRRRIKSGGVL